MVVSRPETLMVGAIKFALSFLLLVLCLFFQWLMNGQRLWTSAGLPTCESGPLCSESWDWIWICITANEGRAGINPRAIF